VERVAGPRSWKDRRFAPNHVEGEEGIFDTSSPFPLSYSIFSEKDQKDHEDPRGL
jgi:hypothetical protein